MFCNNCGQQLEPGKRFCTSCGAEQVQGAGAVPPPPPGQVPSKKGSGGMKTATIAILAVVLVLAMAGLGFGLYFGLKGSAKKGGGGTTGETTSPNNGETTVPGGNTTTGAKSEKIAYISTKNLYTVNLDGTGQTKITTRGDIVDFAVAPDGSRLAFVAATGDQRIIFMLNPDGSGEQQVTLPEKGTAENPTFDPTSHYIYFTRVTAAQQANITNTSLTASTSSATTSPLTKWTTSTPTGTCRSSR